MSHTALTAVFAETLGIAEEAVNDELSFNTIPEWDSVAHMNLIAAIEAAYDIMMETDDVIDLSSVARARQILLKYEVVV